MHMCYIYKLEIRGRAQREDAGRRNSDWETILGGWNSAPRDVTWPESNFISLHSTRSVDLGWVNMHAYNFVVSGPKFTWEKLLITCFSDFW